MKNPAIARLAQILFTSFPELTFTTSDGTVVMHLGGLQMSVRAAPLNESDYDSWLTRGHDDHEDDVECPACEGSGTEADEECSTCEGEGMIGADHARDLKRDYDMDGGSLNEWFTPYAKPPAARKRAQNPIRDIFEVCTACEGTGEVTSINGAKVHRDEEPFPCTRCKGYRVVLANKKNTGRLNGNRRTGTKAEMLAMLNHQDHGSM